MALGRGWTRFATPTTSHLVTNPFQSIKQTTLTPYSYKKLKQSMSTTGESAAWDSRGSGDNTGTKAECVLCCGLVQQP